ncbi:MAG: hypothetical protein LM573_04435 [Thermofilum sp.]|nr:hypothetical protein [Thermofilum sp.]
MLALDLDKDKDTPVIVRCEVRVALDPGQARAPDDSGPVAIVESGPESRRRVAVRAVHVAHGPQELVVYGAVAVIGARLNLGVGDIVLFLHVFLVKTANIQAYICNTSLGLLACSQRLLGQLV